MKRRCLAVMALTLFTTASAVAQSNTAGCSLVDGTRRAQFITFHDLTGEGGKFYLRLHNNSTCPIIVEADGHPVQMVKHPAGGVKFEPATGEVDGVIVALHHLVHDRRRQKVQPAYDWGHVVFTYEIPSGKSILFQVSSAVYKKLLDVAVPFNYVWDGEHVGAGGVGGVTHKVYFLYDDLPKDKLGEMRDKGRQRVSQGR